MDILVFVVLILLSALFAAAETALFSLRESQVRLMVKDKEKDIEDRKSEPNLDHQGKAKIPTSSGRKPKN